MFSLKHSIIKKFKNNGIVTSSTNNRNTFKFRKKLNFIPLRTYMYGDPYIILGVSRFATPEEVRKAFLEKAKKYHPDINKDPDSHEKFLRYKKAYEQIKNGKPEETHTQYQYRNQYSNPNYYNNRNQYYQYSSQYHYRSSNTSSSYYSYEYYNYDETERQHRENIKKMIEPILHYLLIGFLVTLTIISMFSGMSNHKAAATKVHYEPSRYTGPIRVVQMSPTSFTQTKRNVHTNESDERIRRKRREEFYGIQR